MENNSFTGMGMMDRTRWSGVRAEQGKVDAELWQVRAKVPIVRANLPKVHAEPTTPKTN